MSVLATFRYLFLIINSAILFDIIISILFKQHV